MPGRDSSRWRSETKSVRPGVPAIRLDALGLLDHHRLRRDVLVAAGVGGGDLLDLVHRVRALDHLAEDRVAPALRALAAVVEEVVVLHVDEELRGGRVAYAGARH